MSAPAYTPPPYAEPRITVSRTPSPVREGPYAPDAFIPGVELIVSKLPRDSVTSAAHHLQALLEEYNLLHPAGSLVPVRIVAGDERNPVDYVFVSVDPDVTHDPRPDLLQQVRHALVSAHGLQAEWKVGTGPDRTRRVHFKVDSFAQAEALQPKLNDYLNEHSCPFQGSFISKAMNRITYDLLDRSTVDKLFQTPPVIDHQPLFPSITPYIQPIYGLEVAVLGLKDVVEALPVLNHYIRHHYGYVIASSRLALGGDAYCVVFNTPAQTSRFLSDPFTAFESVLGMSHSVSHVGPALLYVLNSIGLPSDSSSVLLRVRHLQAQIDMLQQTIEAWVRATEELLTRQDQMLQQLQDHALHTAASFANLSTIMSASTRLQAAKSLLGSLHSDRRTSERLLAFAPPDRSGALAQQLQLLESDISAQTADVSQAQDSFNAAVRLLPAPAFPSPIVLSAPTPSAAPDTQSLTPTPDDINTASHQG